MFWGYKCQTEKNAKFDELQILAASWIRQMAKVFMWTVCSFIYCLVLTILCTVWVSNRTNEFVKCALQVTPYILVNYGIPMVSTWLIAYSVEKKLQPKLDGLFCF